MQLGRFDLGERLGRGGMATVWTGRHARTGTTVAIKVLEAASAASTEALHREARAIAALDHPSVVRVLDFGRVPPGLDLPEGAPWLAMERASHAVRPPQRWEEARTLLLAVLDALAHAHARRILHLDVKPANVLVRPDGSLALADFGLARAFERSADETLSSSWGTPAYMAPERFGELEELIREPADLFAVGALAVWATQGTPPHAVRTWSEAARLQGTPWTYRPRFPVPAGLEPWIRSLTEPAPLHRPRSAAEARAGLAALGSPVVGAAIGHHDDSYAPTRPRGVDPIPARPADTSLRRGARHSPTRPRLPDTPPTPTPAPQVVRDVGTALIGLRAFPLQGRQPEQRQLWTALKHVEQPQRHLLTGPPGCGKSALGRWVAEVAAEHGVAQVFRVAREHPWEQLARDWLRTHEPERAERIALALLGVRPLLARAVVRLATGSMPRRIDQITVIRSLLQAQDRPVLLWVDDPDADLAAELVELPAFVVAARRDPLDWPTLTLEPLTTKVVKHTLNVWGGVGHLLCQQLVERCGSDLRRATRLVVTAVREDALISGPYGLELRDGHALTDVLDQLSLPDGERGRAWVFAAVLGERVDPEVFSALTPASAQAEDDLARRGWCTGPPLQWVDSGAREAVLAAADDLNAIRLRVAEALDDDPWRRGQLRWRAGDLDRAVPDLLDGLRAQVIAGQDALALERLTRVEQALKERDWPLEDVAWGEVWVMQAHCGRARDAYARCMELAEKAGAHARAHSDGSLRFERLAMRAVSQQALLTRLQGDLPTATGHYADAIERAERLGDTELLAGLSEGRGWLELNQGRHAEGAKWFERSAMLARSVGADWLAFVAQKNLAFAALWAGDAQQAVDQLQAANVVLEAGGYLHSRADLYNGLGDAYRALGALDDAEQWYQRCIQVSHEGGSMSDLTPRINLGLTWLARGDGARAREVLQACTRAFHEQDRAVWAALCEVLEIHAAGLLGDWTPYRRLPELQATLQKAGFVDPDLLRAAEGAEEAARAAGQPNEVELAAAIASWQRSALGRG